ncbi:MAG: hypothetical protein NTV01_12645 [Bacteroidia bacterium]|nr:hypothetical protein [Bacteroidia bacterium]
MKNRVHLICNAHLDPVWQWRWTEGCSEAIATFRNAVEIIHEYPELVFNHNEAILYQWVQKYDNGLFNEIRELVEKNRWFIAGGWYLQPDINLPPYENLVRHISFGRDYFRTEFGVEPRVAYNFDSFGHPAGLPKLLRDFGYELYIHQRPEQEFLDLPGSLYQWKGLDDCTIPAYRIEIGLYHTERKNITQRLTEATNLALELNRDVALFWGLGDHGGGATRIDLDRMREFTANEQRVEFMHSTTDRFYEAIKPWTSGLPVFEGSLQRVFTGCYTSLARIKRRAVEASAAAVQAERLIAEVPTPWPPPLAKGGATLRGNACATTPSLLQGGGQGVGTFPVAMEDIWRDILFNDFHDILPGSCTEPAEQDALDLYGRAMENIRRLNMGSITAINQSAEAIKAHIPLTVFNSNPGLSTFPVEFECMSDYRPLWEGEWLLKLYDRDGNEIPCQEEQPEARLPFHRWRRKISFLAKDMGYGVHHLYLRPESTSPCPLLRKEGVNQEQLSSPRRQGPLDNAPSPLTPSFLRRGQGEVSFLVLPDTADSWGTNQWAWREVIGTFETEHEEQIIENGPIRTIHEFVLSFHHSKIIIHRICYAEWPVTEYKIRIQWNEEQKRLKLAIPAGMENPRLMAQIPGGSQEFAPDSQEHVHGTWLTLEQTDTRHPIPDTHGLHIAHTGLHGFDFDGHTVRLSVLRSAAYCHEQGYDLNNGRTHKYMDMGIHEIRLAIWEKTGEIEDGRTRGSSLTDPAWVAEWLNAPPLVWPHLPIG